MKKLMLLTVLALGVLLLNGCKHNVSNNTNGTENTANQMDQMYDFETAIVEYVIGGGTRSGTKTMYIRNGGREEATYVDATTTVGGFSVPENTIFIRNGFELRNYDLISNTGTYTEVPENVRGMGREEGEAMMEAMGAVDAGTKTVAGKTCQVKRMESLGTEVCYWNGLALLTTSNIAGITVTETATSVETDVDIPAEKFELPVADEELQDVTQLQNQILQGGIPAAPETSPDESTGRGEPVDMEEMEEYMKQAEEMMERYGQ